ncbi:MAG: DNA primase [Candidatus Omnitrophota bacterium]
MGLIPEEIISQVLDRCHIVEIVAGYVPLKRAGRNFKANCPFHHEKTPSFVVNPDKQIFHCFGCGEGGNVISFIAKQERLEFPEAVRFLAEKVGIQIPTDERSDPKVASLNQLIYQANELAADFFHTTLALAENESVVTAVKYLKGRGINLDIVKKFQLGFAPESWDKLINHLRSKNITINVMEKAGLVVPRENRDGFFDRFRNRIIFPIFDSRSRCVAFGARTMQEGVAAKYINSPETPIYTKGNHLYGFHLTKDAVRVKDFAIVVEGYMDFIIPFQAGVDNIVASLGTALTVEQIRLIRRYTENIVMLFDADKAGESAMIRSLDLLIEEGINVKVAILAAGEDPDSFIRKFGVEEFNERIAQAQPLIEYKLKTLMGKYSHKTVEGKASIAKEMLPTIAKFKNAVMKFGYIKQLSSLLAIPEQALLTELQKVPQLNSREEKIAPLVAPFIKARIVERNLLKLLLSDESLIPLLKDRVQADDFHDKDIRQIIGKILFLVDQGQEATAANLINTIGEGAVATMIAQLTASDEALTGDKEKMFHDFVNRIKSDQAKSKRQDLLGQIKDAEMSGDSNKLDELKHQFNQLIKR